MNENALEHEALVRELMDDELRADYARPYDNYWPGLLPSFFGWLLITSGTLMYGRKPSYGKFKAIEVIARIPYQSWEVAAYTLLSAFHGDEKYAMKLTRAAAFSRAAQDNETMHVVVISHLAKSHGGIGPFRHTLLPLLFALVYFWLVYFLYMLSHRAALELNYVFEKHAYAQYQEFLDTYGDELKKRTCVSDFLTYYGRSVMNEYEFFATVRNDELIHRNRSIREIEALQ